MKHVRMFSGLLLAAALAVSACAARADESGDQLKALTDKFGAAIVTVKLVLKTEVNMMGQSREDEQRTELHGVVVDPEGLIMVPGTALSGDSLGDMLGGGDEFQVKMTPTDIKVIVEREEKEYNAFLAATDSKLGLGFLKIEDLGDRKLTAVDFSSAVDAGIGQVVAQVARQSKGYDYALYFETGRVSGEIAKPRKAWMIDGDLSGFALPVFTPKGEIVGVVTHIADGMRREEGGGMGGGRGFGRMMRMFTGGGFGGGRSSFILPGSVVKGVIGQAKTKAVEVAAERAKQKEEEAKEGEKGEGEGEGGDKKIEDSK